MKKLFILLALLACCSRADAQMSRASATKLYMQVVDRSTGGPKTGETGTTLTFYVSIDGSAPSAIIDTAETELSSTNAPGVYTVNLTVSETNGKALSFTGKSTTANADVIPQFVYTGPQNGDVEVLFSDTAASFAGSTVTVSTTPAGLTLGSTVIIRPISGTGSAVRRLVSVSGAVLTLDAAITEFTPAVGNLVYVLPTPRQLGTAAVADANIVSVNGSPADPWTEPEFRTQVQQAQTDQGYTTARAPKLDNLDAAVTTRLATTGYTAPLDAAATATAVQTGMNAQGYSSTRAPKLDNLDVAVGTRLATTGYTAPLSSAATATAVQTGMTAQGYTAAKAVYIDPAVYTQSATDALTTAGITSVVMARLDQPVSSRLAASSYVDPLDAAQTQAAAQAALTAQGYTSGLATGLGTTNTNVTGIKSKTDFLPGVAPGAAGGLFQVGVNAPTSITGTGLTATLTGNLTGSVGSVVGNVGGNVLGTVASVVGAVGSVTGNVGGNVNGNVVGTVASVVGAVGSVTGNVGGNVVGNVTGTIGGLTANAVKDFFDTNSTMTAATAVAGSVVKEIVANAGTGSLTEATIAQAVWEYTVDGIGNPAIAGGALEQASDATWQIGNVLSGLESKGYTTARANYIDAAVSTRLATAGYVEAPSASDVATAVRIEIDPELDRIDQPISSRLATSGYTVPPTPAANATATRAELGPELGRIDVATSTRLSAASYVTPLDAAATAGAVQAGMTAQGFTSAKASLLDAAISSRLPTSGYTAPMSAQATRDAVGKTAPAGSPAPAAGSIDEMLKKTYDAARTN